MWKTASAPVQLVVQLMKGDEKKKKKSQKKFKTHEASFLVVKVPVISKKLSALFEWILQPVKKVFPF